MPVGVATLQRRHEQIDQVLITLRRDGTREVETIDIRFRNPGRYPRRPAALIRRW